MNDWEPNILTRDDLFLPHADIRAWRAKHPRVHKRHPHFLVDFEDAGCYKIRSTDDENFDKYYCPWHFTNIRTIVLERDNNLCRVCGSDGSDCKKVAWSYFPQVYVPAKDGGSDHPANLITLCRRCHKQTFRLDYGGVPGMNVEQTTIVPKEE